MRVGSLVKVVRDWRMGPMTFGHLVGRLGKVLDLDDEGWARIRVGSETGSAPLVCLEVLEDGPL